MIREIEREYLDFADLVNSYVKRFLKLEVQRGYQGKYGGKVKQKFYESCVRFIGFLLWRHSKTVEAGVTDEMDAVIFPRREQESLSQYGISNPKRVRKWLVDRGILVPKEYDGGVTWFHLSGPDAGESFCKRYQVCVKGSVMDLTQLQSKWYPVLDNKREVFDKV